MPLERLLDFSADPPDPERLYTRLDFPDPPSERPYVFINMASTVDGKIVIGEIGGTAQGVGGPTDQMLFRRLQQQADAALIGSATLRASQVIYPPRINRYVVTRTGDVPLQNRFFTDAPDRAFVLLPEHAQDDINGTKDKEAEGKAEGKGETTSAETLARVRATASVLEFGTGDVDLAAALRFLRQAHGIRHLLCEGGAALNDALIRAGLADELFLTLAPKIKGGANLPTLMTGQGFAAGTVLPLHLHSLYRDGDELYLRYRMGTAPHRV